MIRLTKTVTWLVLCSAMLASIASAQDDAASQRYFTGNALYNRKMYKLAIEEYRIFLAEHPAHAKAANARMGMALSHYALGDFAAAAPLLNDLVAQNVGDGGTNVGFQLRCDSPPSQGVGPPFPRAQEERNLRRSDLPRYQDLTKKLRDGLVKELFPFF